MRIEPIQSIEGAHAREDGMIKLPDAVAIMPNGGFRTYKTKWIRGTIRRASKSARHSYYGILYRGKNYKIHRLVCEAFYGKPASDDLVVLHLNEDATDNRLENIRWGTQKENLNAVGFLAYCRSRTGENSPAAKGAAKKKVVA
jgi:hypothetical protein